MTDSANHSKGDNVPGVAELSERVSRLSTAFDFWTDLSLWLTALTAVFGLLYFGTSWIANRRAKELTGAEIALRDALDKNFERELRAKDDAIAFVQNETSRANVTAANASMQGTRTALELEKQRERTAKAEARVLELEAKNVWRSIPDDVFKRLVEALRLSPIKGNVQVAWVDGDPEPAAYGRRLENALQAAGWKTSNTAMLGMAGTGLYIVVKDGTKPPAHAVALQQVLESLGIKAEGAPDPRSDEALVRLLVLTKP